jgi:TM2 domain-containing membrane protein YozV
MAVLIFTILMFFSPPAAWSQSKAKIQNVDFYAQGSNVIITYDISGSAPGEAFTIWIQVKTASGKVIYAKTISGDIGKGIAGGAGKRIEWNVAADQVSLEEEIGIEVFASPEVVVAKTETQAALPVEKQPGTREISVGKAMAFSILLPGLGKTYIKKGGATWLMGVAAYGLVAGSVLANHAAYDRLEEYRATFDPEMQDQLYNEAVGMATVSYICFAGAITIWTVDLITTGVKAGKARRAQSGTIGLRLDYEPRLNVPMIGIAMKF